MAKTSRKNTSSRIIILGHTGLIGGSLKHFLRKKLPKSKIYGFSSKTLDLTRKDQLATLAKHCTPKTTLIFCSAKMKRHHDSIDLFKQNITMTVNVCKVLLKNPVKRVIFLSSAAVYGEDIHNTAITEKTPPQPTSYYGLSKYASELLLQKIIAHTKQSSLLILRPPFVYGPNDPNPYTPVGFLKAAVQREKITLWGDGRELREFVYVDDLVSLTAKLLNSKVSGVLNIASGHSYSFRDSINIISKLCRCDVEVGSRPRTKSRVDHVFKQTRLKKLFPSFRFITLEEGLKMIHEATLFE